MKNRLISLLCMLLLAWLVGLVVPMSAQGTPEDEEAAAATEDVIYMLDGRELHGQILEEKGDVIVFEFLDRDIKIKTNLTLMVDEIGKIERDVPIVGNIENA